MAAGLAVIATRCPSGPDEMIADGADGLLVPSEDPVALGAAIDALLSDDTRRARLGAAARASVGRYSLDKVVARWDQVFDRARRRS
jgi:glycosyltransferase involved in cell wall biosynthesis